MVFFVNSQIVKSWKKKKLNTESTFVNNPNIVYANACP